MTCNIIFNGLQFGFEGRRTHPGPFPILAATPRTRFMEQPGHTALLATIACMSTALTIAFQFVLKIVDFLT